MIKDYFIDKVEKAIEKAIEAGKLGAMTEYKKGSLVAEKPKNANFGDYAVNVSSLARFARIAPPQIANAIVEAAGYFGIPVFDFYHCSNWNPWTVRFTNPESPEAGKVVDNIYTYDGLHPKKGDGNGADLLGTAFGMFINSH